MKPLLALTTAAVATLTATTVLVAPATASATHSSRPSPGAPGIGDPYFPTSGNGGYDVRHYDLRLDYRPATDKLTGFETISATATQSLSMFNLDLHGLTVKGITVNGRPAGWSRDGDELTVHPHRALPKRKAFVAQIAYAGVPKPIDDPSLGLNGWIATDDGADVAGEPYGSSTWFASNDHPLDKASYTFTTTVPKGVEVVANGHLVSHRSHGSSTTWRYDAPDPMAPYLATVDIGQFKITQHKEGGVRYLDAIDPDLFTGDDAIGKLVEASFAKEPEFVRFLSSQFGPYPWHDFGGIVDDLQIGFALETQTRPIHSPLFWVYGGQDYGDVVVVHELAHQWFGDSVAVGRWQDVWLNEGFATYAEWLYGEKLGQTTPEAEFQANLTGIPADDEFWQLAVGDPGPSSLFASPVYTRGAMTLQALRDKIGDKAFFQVLRGWARVRAGGNGTTPQFIAYAERVSHRQLDSLFAKWLGAGYPGTPSQARSAAAKATTKAVAPTLRR